MIFAERIIRTDNRITKLEYRYHYQRDDGTLIFRYDSSPHYPNLATHPHHKHVGDQVIAARPPDLSDVLREIDALIYPQST
ncbi:MAG: hypothetical protein HY784_10765 [Chloroflexi bacterium]|nr:hypothetical protein [Chloroflexota bacterium]